MTFYFRTHRFDASNPDAEGRWRPDELVAWLKKTMYGWRVQTSEHPWGVQLNAERGPFHYIIGIYNGDTVNHDGPRWCVRLFNQKPWYLVMFSNYLPPDPEIADAWEKLITGQPDFTDVEIVRKR